MRAGVPATLQRNNWLFQWDTREIRSLASYVIDHFLKFSILSMCAEQFLTDGDISVDIGIAAAPVITANYIESYHKVNDDFRYIVEYTAVLDRL